MARLSVPSCHYITSIAVLHAVVAPRCDWLALDTPSATANNTVSDRRMECHLGVILPRDSA